MKDYLWIIIASVFALIALFFFILTISNGTSLIKKLKKNKLHVLTNITILLIGFGNIGLVIYLLQDVRRQIETFSAF
ncbi:hypothetical protein [Vagococcus fluvialis]|uniref:hypothetical protein n=1 Tax=Vagococcus fluvialis TaxID=2738 RepID=UPI003B590E97